jgi:triacylglycerol lipase
MSIENAAFDPVPPPAPPAPPPERWWGNHLGEFRWQLELARLAIDPIFRGDNVPHGDGAPVVLVPGFLAGDSSLGVMRGWLRRIGYRSYASGILFNVDCSDRAVDALERRVERIAIETGRQVALIGHSRGGHFIKALAKRRPELVSSAISMGSGLDTPFDISIPTQSLVAAVRTVHAQTSDRIAKNGCLSATCQCKFSRDYAGEFPSEVPLTSIYSRGDGVVRWRACIVPYARCVEVSGSHVGLACNRKVYREVARTLARETALSAANRGADAGVADASADAA